MESGLYSCTDKRASKTDLTHKVEWQTCGNDDNKKINRQIATITSTSLYVFVKGKFFIQNNNTPNNNFVRQTFTKLSLFNETMPVLAARIIFYAIFSYVT